MALYYSAANLLDVDTLDSVSTEDTLYVKENLYDNRPSKPFYFTAKAGQWIKVDLGASQQIAIAAIFNHNFTANVIAGLRYYSDAWMTPVHSTGLAYRQHDLWKKIGRTAQYWMLGISDAGNTEYPRLGELWLGPMAKFANAHVQPGREDGVEFFASEQVTAYGQDWDAYLSEAKRLKINFLNINAPANTDDLEAFFSTIRGPEGRFVLIPDHTKPHVFLVKVVGSPTAQRIVYGTKELRAWAVDLKVLTRGITLL